MPSEPPGSARPTLAQPSEDAAVAYAGLTARRLLEELQKASDNRDHPNTQVVFTAFYNRYYPYLYTVVSNELGQIHDREGIQEIVDDALAAFFAACRKFDPSRAPDDKGCDQLIRVYLGRLATWKARRARSFHKSFGADVLDLDAIDAELEKIGGVSTWVQREPAPGMEDKKDQVAAWIASLTEVERDVLRTYFIDDHFGRKSERLPDGIAQALATKHQTTTSNIRYKKLKLERQLREKFPNV